MERLKKIGRLEFKGASEIKSSRIGIGFEKLDRAVFDPEKAYDKVSRIGIKKIRVQSGWQRTERKKGVYDFSWLDSIVDNLMSRGMEVWMCLCYGNEIYTELAKKVFGGVGCPPVGSDEEMQGWLSYVKATVSHFRGRVSLFEVWNEPELSYSWKHFEGEAHDKSRACREYGAFVTATSSAVKEANPDAKVAATMAQVKNLFVANDILSSSDCAKNIDFFIFHAYEVDDSARYEKIRALNALCKSHNPNIKLIQGESGVQSRSDGNGALKRLAWTPEKQCKFLLRTLVQDLYSDVEFTSYFSTMDMIEGLHGRVEDKSSYLDYGYFGVIGADFDENGIASGKYKEKPSYYSLSSLCAVFEGDAHADDFPYIRECNESKRVNGFDSTDATLKSFSFRLDDGRHAIAYWNSTNILTTAYEGTTSMYLYLKNREKLSLVDPMDGSLYSFPDSMEIDCGNRGVRLLNIPLLDYPLIIIIG